MSENLGKISQAPQIWEKALTELQAQINKPNYRTWFEKTTGLDIKDGQFTVGVPNTFIAEYLDKNQRSLIEKVLAGLCGCDVRAEFKVDTAFPGVLANRKTVKPVPAQQGSLPLFNPKYTFDSFTVGTNNHLAYAAALSVTQKPGEYNPLYIYSGSGLGKTHLLQAIGHAALEKNIKVLYVRAEQYTNEWLTAMRERTLEDFRSRYHNADMLLVDDVQFFSGKEKTAENFFHIFDELHNANKQIALTGDRPPQAIPQLPDRLRSRFEWGLVTSIQPPDFDTRLAILQTKACQDGVTVPLDVLEYIALQIQQNIRALEGSLNRVVAYARLIRAGLTPELAAKALKDIGASQPALPQATPAMIIEAVVSSFQLTPADLRGRKRDENTALARQVAMYLIRQETDCSLNEIGQDLGGRNPATVSHAYQKIAGDMCNNPGLKRKVVEIQQKVHSSPFTQA